MPAQSFRINFYVVFGITEDGSTVFGLGVCREDALADCVSAGAEQITTETHNAFSFNSAPHLASAVTRWVNQVYAAEISQQS